MTESQEQRLYNTIVDGGQAGLPLTKRSVKLAAWALSEIDYCVMRNNPLENQGLCTGEVFGPSGPSDKWYRKFKKRWKLSERVTSDREPKRTSALNLAVVEETFGLFEEALTTGNNGNPFELDRVFNMDEFGVQSRSEKQAKGVYIIGSKEACSRTGQGDRCSYTGIACNSAAGKQVPLFLIFKGKWQGSKNQDALVDAISEARGMLAFKPDTHMMSTEVFLDWLRVFQEHTGSSPQNPVLLVLDGHSSRANVTVWKKALSLGIKMFILPGAVTSHMQPQDVGVLGPFKKQLYKMYKERCEDLAGVSLVRVEHVKMLLKAWQTSVGKLDGGVSSVVVKAWDKSGLVCEGTGKPDATRLASAILKAEPCRNKEVELSNKCRELLDAAVAAPLPIGNQAHDLRDRSQGHLPKFPDDAPPVWGTIKDVADDIQKVASLRAKAVAAKLEKEAIGKAKTTKTAKEKNSRLNLHATFVNAEVRNPRATREISGRVRRFPHDVPRGVHRPRRIPIHPAPHRRARLPPAPPPDSAPAPRHRRRRRRRAGSGNADPPSLERVRLALVVVASVRMTVETTCARGSRASSWVVTVRAPRGGGGRCLDVGAHAQKRRRFFPPGLECRREAERTRLTLILKFLSPTDDPKERGRSGGRSRREGTPEAGGQRREATEEGGEGRGARRRRRREAGGARCSGEGEGSGSCCGEGGEGQKSCGESCREGSGGEGEGGRAGGEEGGARGEEGGEARSEGSGGGCEGGGEGGGEG